MTSLAAHPKPTGSAEAAPSAVGPRPMCVLALHDVVALETHIPAWESLASAAIEPNVFHEPWMMLPALRHFAAGQDLVFVLIFAADPARPQGPGLLCGFFPLQRQRRYKGMPLPHLRIWRHLHSVLSTPLVRTGYGPETLQALFDWLRRDSLGSNLLEFNFVSADGPFHHLLVEHFNEQGRLIYTDEVTTRAVLRVGDDGEAYLQTAMSGGNRKELRRQRRRLGELGRLETRGLEPDDDLEPWIDGFLDLESSGWKGQHGTALGAHENERDFFREVARAAFARKRLMMLGCFLDDKPIALKCNFLMGEGSIAFKIAFDESYARFSAGVQLEVDNILHLHAMSGPRWMDSCAVSRHFMINRMWKDRRVLQTLLISAGRFGGDLTVSLLPLLRWVRRLVRRP